MDNILDILGLFLIIFLFVTLIVTNCDNNHFSGIVIDKFITNSRSGYPHFFIIIDNGEDVVTREINQYDYYYGYFEGYSYEFE